MRKMGESVVSFYLQLSLTILIGAMMLIQNATFSFIYDFTIGAWIFLIGSSIINILGSMTKFMAIKYHSASDLQKLAFLPNVWQFIIDIFFMHAVFSGLELTGFICLFVFYAGYLTWFVRSSFSQDKTAVSTVQESDDHFKEAPLDIEQNAFDSQESKAT